jgi:hypothetical protein
MHGNESPRGCSSRGLRPCRDWREGRLLQQHDYFNAVITRIVPTE